MEILLSKQKSLNLPWVIEEKKKIFSLVDDDQFKDRWIHELHSYTFCIWLWKRLRILCDDDSWSKAADKDTERENRQQFQSSLVSIAVTVSVLGYILYHVLVLLYSMQNIHTSPMKSIKYPSPLSNTLCFLVSAYAHQWLYVCCWSLPLTKKCQLVNIIVSLLSSRWYLHMMAKYMGVVRSVNA